MRSPLHLLAFDYGASNGRAIMGMFDGHRFTLSEAYRFSNDPVQLPDALYWDVLRLYAELQLGLQKASATFGAPDAIGIDTWGVDYGLLDSTGRLIANPVHYRDTRTDGMMEYAFSHLAKEEIFRQTGLAFMPFNTLYQLLSIKGSSLWDDIQKILFMPDLLAYFLTGEIGAEYTIASTGQLIDPGMRSWAEALLSTFEFPRSWFSALNEPGQIRGFVDSIPVVSVASHDTASAVAAIPVEGNEPFAYISSGTWSLLGVETNQPIRSEAVLAANYTNEGGVFGTTRVLKNIMGLWIIQECRRIWQREGLLLEFDEIAALAQNSKPFVSFIDPDAALFILPGDMPGRIRSICQKTDQPIPESPGQVARIIYECLALKYRWAIERLEQDILGLRLERLHIVGGGSQNRLLNQMTADALNRPIIAGPAEATAMGNVLMQAVALGELKDLIQVRAVAKESTKTSIFLPHNSDAWDDAYGRFLHYAGR